MAEQDKLEETLNDLLEKAETNRIKTMAATMGIETDGLTVPEITKMLESVDVDEHIANLKEAKAKAARLALEKQASYAAVALNDVEMGSLTDTEKKFVRELKSADLSLMSATDIRDFIKVVDNIVLNDNFSSAYDVVSKSKAYKNVKEATEIFNKEELGFLRSDKKSAVTNFKTLSLMFKTVFKNGKKSARFNRLSGLLDLSMGYTMARKKVKQLGKDYDKKIKEVAKTKNRAIRKSENTMLRGVVGQLIQGSTKEDFDINKSRMEDHIKNLRKSGGEAVNRSAEKLEGIYDQFKDMKSQDEVIEYTKNHKRS
jgi:ribosomal protein L12E/L44/L45/RPP1/RPP2